jgi:uncharacterized protein YaaN involved in tellurite resistance
MEQPLAPAPLAPPAGLSTLPLLLEPPAPPPVVEPDQAAAMVKLDPQVIPELDRQVDKFVQDILALELGSEAFANRVGDAHRLGQEAIASSAASSNRLMERPVRAMESGLFDDRQGVGKSLVDLRQKMDELNPKRFGNLLEPRKLLGLIPFGSRLEDYFDSYRSAESHIAAILKNLAESKDEIIRDNAAIEQEKLRLWEAMQRLEQYVYIAKAVDVRLTEKAAALEAADPHKARVIREELVFAVRQRVTDLLTQTAVSIQGYLAMDVIRKTNLELVKGVDRASTTTVSALRTAVMTAQALGVQKMVLEQIKALNATTENLIVATSEMMKQQSAEIYQQAASPTIAVEKLQQAFDNSFAAFDMIADFKLKSLDAMQKTVDALTVQVDRARQYTDRVRGEALQDVTEAGLVTGVARL